MYEYKIKQNYRIKVRSNPAISLLDTHIATILFKRFESFEKVCVCLGEAYTAAYMYSNVQYYATIV